MTEFARLIKQKRKEKKLTLEELASKLRSDKSHLSRLENGMMFPPSKLFVKKLSKVLLIEYKLLCLLAGIIPKSIIKNLDLNKVKLFISVNSKKISREKYKKIIKIINVNKR